MYDPAQHSHLVPERSIFGFKSAFRLKRRDQDGKDKTEQRESAIDRPFDTNLIALIRFLST